jgi:hypothetical protein
MAGFVSDKTLSPAGIWQQHATGHTTASGVGNIVGIGFNGRQVWQKHRAH